MVYALRLQHLEDLATKIFASSTFGPKGKQGIKIQEALSLSERMEKVQEPESEGHP